jgi:hypothetical protein
VQVERPDYSVLGDVGGDWSAQPVCELHGLKMGKCGPCCVLLFEGTVGMREGERHSWAVANVYKAKELW